MSSFDNRIAIVGLGGVFPGARTLDDFWQLVRSGRTATCQVPADRWLIDPSTIRSDEVAPDRVLSDRACFLDSLDLDLSDVSLDPGLVRDLDPMIHIALRAGTDAFRSAKLKSIDPSRIGIWLGNIALPTEKSSLIAREIYGELFEAAQNGRAPSAASLRTNPWNRLVTGLPATLLARSLGLGGGASTLDAACASSLYALRFAAEALLSGRVDAMLAGGLSRPDGLYTQMGFSQLRALSKKGRCAPFDQGGDGLIVGEGAGVFVLKRLGDAVRDGDTIHGVLCGFGLSNDRTGRLLAPSSEGQLRAMRHAYRMAEWRPSDVDLVECHATGTPLGDGVEVESLKQLWQGEGFEPGQCVIGSVKSNVGHLLTGAGAAGMMKVLLALQHGEKPPTASFESAPAQWELDRSPFRVLRDAAPWKHRSEDTPRRAAVSAFGFGGINAHVLVEEWRADSKASVPVPELPKPEPLEVAIVGIATHFGPFRDRLAFQRRVLGGDTDSAPKPVSFSRGARAEDAIHGFPIESFDVPRDRFRVPPKELEDSLPQQVLMLDAAAEALADADWKPEAALETGVFIGLGLDLDTTSFSFRWSVLKASDDAVPKLDAAGPPLTANRTMGALGGIVASRIAREFTIGGPSLTVSSEEDSSASALEAAVRCLQSGEVRCALVGAVDVASDPRSALATHRLRAFSRGGESSPFSPDSDGVLLGEGAAAVVLKPLDAALADGDRVYAVLRGIGLACGSDSKIGPPDEATYRRAVERALREADLEIGDLDYLEVHGSGDPEEDRLESEALQTLFDGRHRQTPCTLGTTKRAIGHCGAAAGLASLAKTALCLYQQILPPADLDPADLDGDHLVFPERPRYWLHDRMDGPRRAGVSSLSLDGACHHIILEECEDAVREEERLLPIGDPEECLFVVEGDAASALRDGLVRLRSMAQDTRGPIFSLARSWHEAAPPIPKAKQAIALVTRSGDELVRLIERAEANLERTGCAQDPGEDRRGRPRVFHTLEPLGRKGDVAFVFPGSGQHYAGMGRRIGIEYPDVLRRQQLESWRLRSQWLPDVFWSHRGDQELDAAHEAVIFGQVAFGTLSSDLVRHFGIEPDAAIGYSLGESAGLFSMRTWSDRDDMLSRIRASKLFKSQLAGDCSAAREVWNLRDEEDVDWTLGVVDRPASEIEPMLADRARVYRLIVNTPDECVIGGRRADVEAFVKEIGCGFHSLRGVTTVHCEIAEAVREDYFDLHVFEVCPPPGVKTYSGVRGSAFEVTSTSAAESILGQALHGFDFTRVIESAYRDGARVFIELGPGTSCTRMIQRILRDRPHAALTAGFARQDGTAPFVRLLAALATHRVPFDRDRLFEAPPPIETHVSSHPPIHYELIAPPFEKVTSARATARPRVKIHSDTVSTHHNKPPIAPSDPDRIRRPIDEVTSAAAAPQPGRTVSADTAAHDAHASFLAFSRELAQTMEQTIAWQQSLVARRLEKGPATALPETGREPSPPPQAPPARDLFFDREQCLAFGTGKIGPLLGPDYAPIDAFPTRVRLPDEPLMLVDRILTVEGEPLSMGSGRVVTEHDVTEDRWYLDGDRIPTGVAVESGQADLFLSGYLGIDLHTRGLSMYRLLDAVVTFHRGLPRPGEVIRYDIRILRFFRQGGTMLFKFEFDGTVNGEPLLTMREGCAGFFSHTELSAGKGIVETRVQKPQTGKGLTSGYRPLVPFERPESCDGTKLARLRGGDLEGAFGRAFEGLPLHRPFTIPGGWLDLIDRVTEMRPGGGRYGLGFVRAEKDIVPDAWFLTCHFVDDQVMPGTLMYESSLHALRVLLLRLGWIGEDGQVACEPIAGISSQLKCRGQVIATTRKAAYEVSIKELGYRPAPYAIADVLMFADGKPIVEITDMTVQLTGLTRESIERLWSERSPETPSILYDKQSILAFATGKPSEAFGDRYRVFDAERQIARLPGPPYDLMDRVVAVRGEPWVLEAGMGVTSEYDVPVDAWYFEANRQEDMPFAVLLEIALQPCGWLAAYGGSALTSETDLRFRNLGGEAVLHRPVRASAGTLTVDVTMTACSQSGGMIIQHFDFKVSDREGSVYEGKTYFGFFTAAALANQVGIREAQPYVPEASELELAQRFPMPTGAPFPDERWRMIDHVELVPGGGPGGLGFVRGTMDVDESAWFFAAHFYQDPVVPGSLGLESFLQLLAVRAHERWPDMAELRGITLGQPHAWTYRGQVIPADQRVTVEAVITEIDDEKRLLRADGFLSVDGRLIYQMKDFTLSARPNLS
ncbi:MAG: beta-ketoacyl synthase N-terminal-like domain-containing protein [Planctomycetota bacterium]